ncbi:MAG: hypothetical protein IJ636_03570 [Bacteroidales bacterium]|nr:hypothetical protein [Bacteroidales bacterium]
MAVRTSPVILLILLLAAACCRPTGDFHLVSTETAREEGGAFRFEIPVTDSGLVVTTSLAARLVTSRVAQAQIELDFHITPPDGETFIERHTFPLEAAPGVRINLGPGSVTDFEWPWREIRTGGSPAGTWTISIIPSDPALLDALYGLGLSYETSIWEKAN